MFKDFKIEFISKNEFAISAKQNGRRYLLTPISKDELYSLQQAFEAWAQIEKLDNIITFEPPLGTD